MDIEGIIVNKVAVLAHKVESPGRKHRTFSTSMAAPSFSM